MAEPKELEIGNIVRLNSGGPKMTVKSIEENNEVICQWFARTNIKRLRFNTACLTKLNQENNDASN